MPIKKETGKTREFSTGAKKQPAAGKGTPVLVPGDAILEVAKHFEEGAAVHGDRNWEKGIPLSELLNSLERHLQQEKMGLTDESHDRAILWNAIVYMATKLRIVAGILPVELDDMPRYNKYYFAWKIAQSCTAPRWYIVNLKDGCYYLHNDLVVRDGAFPESTGYYKTEKLAEATLRAYLNKEEIQSADVGEVIPYCHECSERMV